MKEVAMPKKAATHIQNSAPGPPVEMAPVTPTMLPAPTRMAVLSMKEAMGLIPVCSSAFFLNRTLTPRVKKRS